MNRSIQHFWWQQRTWNMIKLIEVALSMPSSIRSACCLETTMIMPCHDSSSKGTQHWSGQFCHQNAIFLLTMIYPWEMKRLEMDIDGTLMMYIVVGGEKILFKLRRSRRFCGNFFFPSFLSSTGITKWWIKRLNANDDEGEDYCDRDTHETVVPH